MVQVITDKQPWLETWFEIITNIVVGFLLSLIGNTIYLAWYDLPVTASMMGGLALFMTILSILRQLVLRRFYECVRVHRYLPHLYNFWKDL